MKKKILITTNTSWNLVNFRTNLIQRIICDGFEVVAVSPQDAYVARLEALGCRHIPLSMDNKGTNPLNELLLFWSYLRLLDTEKPDLCLFFTVKPNVYGSLAASLLRIKYINNVSGLGSVFIKGGWLKILLILLYKLAFNKSSNVFFQNKDDQGLFLNYKLVSKEQAAILPGSGIDLNHFKSNNSIKKPTNKPFRFLLIARMLKDKGIFEYVHAAQAIIKADLKAEFCLLGFLDVQNPAAISKDQMQKWENSGFIKYLGTTDDVRDFIDSADCIVLPSYREGTPRSLLEAAAMSKPIITTDSIGCKEVVEHGTNGLICKVKNEFDLELKMKEMLLLSDEQRESMGKKGRLKMEKEYDDQIVIKKYLSAIEFACNK